MKNINTLEETINLWRDKIIPWFGEHNIHLERGRLCDYEKGISKLSRAQKANEIVSPKDFEKFYRILHEMGDIEEIYSCLNNYHENGFDQKLKEITKGTVLFSDEKNTSNNMPRNKLFEILLGGYMKEMGYTISFDNSDDSDLIFGDSINQFMVECKRPFHVNQIENNVKKANKQLKRKIDIVNSITDGIVAISLSRCLNPKSGLLQINELKDLDKALEDWMLDIIENYITENVRMPERTIGFIFHYSGVIHLSEIDRPVYVSKIIFQHVEDSYSINKMNSIYNKKSNFNMPLTDSTISSFRKDGPK